jgi:alkyl hydroperoxide reductase subunit AhpC
VFVIGPDKRIKLSIAYPMTTGRNFDDRGDDVIIVSSVSDEEAKKIFPQGWKAPRPYIRIVPQPLG